jgi:recombination protein RecT
MTTAVATRPAEKTEVALARSFDDLQKTMIGYLANARDKIGSIIDERSIVAAVGHMRSNPKLLECTPQSVFLGIVQAGSYGWMCDGITGHASLVPFRQGKDKQGNYKPSKATLIPGYKGLMDLVRRSGQCEPTMESVHDGDTYQYRGRFQEPLHIRSSDPNRRQRPITHAYVLGVFRGGMIKCFSWTREECIAHRDAHVKNWQSEVAYAKKDGRPTDEDNLWHERNAAFPVMCCKTVMRHAINRGEFPISVKDMRLLAQEDEIDGTVLSGMSQEEVAMKASMDAAVVEFDSPAGYSETLHQEPVTGYAVDSPGDDIAADAEKHLPEQTPATADPRAGWLKDLAACKTVEAVDQLVADALNGPDGVDIRQAGEDKKSAMTFLERERTSSRKR